MGHWVKKYEKGLGYEFNGVYDFGSNQLLLKGNFDGTKNVGAIIHECSHFRELNYGHNYDVAKMDRCVKNLKKLGVSAVQCLDSRSADCDRVENLASNYRDRDVLVGRNIVDVDNPSKAKTGVRGVFSIGAGLPDLKNNKGAIIAFTASDDQTIYSLELDSTQNIKTGKGTPASQEQKDLYKMAQNIGAAPTLKDIGTMYKKADKGTKIREYHAAIVDKAPEAVLDEACPDGLSKESPSKKPQPAKAGKFSSPQSPEL